LKEFSTRQLKVGQEIKSVLSEIFMRGDFYDPQTFATLHITVSEVRVSPDLRNATVFFSPLGGKDQERMEDVLNPMAGKIKGLMGRKIQLKRIPSLHFKLDKSFENAAKINSLIDIGYDANGDKISSEE